MVSSHEATIFPRKPNGLITARLQRFHALIIDEVQRVPSLLSVIKKTVDEDTRPGQYLLTGSANIQSLPTVRESLAGRIAKIRLRPLAQGEIKKIAPRFIESALKQSFSHSQTHYDRDAILEIGFSVGFPEPMILEPGRNVNSMTNDEIARFFNKNRTFIQGNPDPKQRRSDESASLSRFQACKDMTLMSVLAEGDHAETIIETPIGERAEPQQLYELQAKRDGHHVYYKAEVEVANGD